jgi:hypothetical protein
MVIGSAAANGAPVSYDTRRIVDSTLHRGQMMVFLSYITILCSSSTHRAYKKMVKLQSAIVI